MRRIHILIILLLVGCALTPLQANTSVPATTTAVEASAVASEGIVSILNRPIVTFRAPLYGVSAPDRARRAQNRIDELLAIPGAHAITQKQESAFTMVQIDGATAFSVMPEDADKLNGETLQSASNQAAQALERVITESRESRSFDAISRALGFVTLATLAALTLGWLLSRARKAIKQWLFQVLQRHADHLQLGGIKLLHQQRAARIAQLAVSWLFRLLLFVLIYEWLSFTLASFPFTRAWGELLNGFLWGLAAQLGSGIAAAMPGVFTATVIFYLALTFTRALDGFFERVRSQQIVIQWLDPEVVLPTRRIAKLLVWIFALAMAYPYLPGSQTEAFKGLSVLLGLMISLGASNLVGQGASGLILTYGRVFRKGEFVRVGQHEGTVMELGIFTTRIRTGLGEELTLANSSILNETTLNYSRSVSGDGYILDTQVTIGYDTPWRQVHALLIAAAQRTPGILSEPAPQVFQTALSDWYPQYRLVCQAIPSEPRPRAMLLSALHANIQDVFNEYGVQIMSPNYFVDPTKPKLVPPEKWYAEPAVKPDQTSRPATP